MAVLLNDVEQRVLGCLIEKEITTPDYYPLTLNAVTTACNQKSNRDPVVQFEESAVQQALDSLRQKGLAAVVTGAGIRTPKYRHYGREKLGLQEGQIAILCELLLRGPQTLGELRTHGERMFTFLDLSEVETVLQELATREQPLVQRLPRQSGHKEQRYIQLLGGEPDLSLWTETTETATPLTAERMELLEARVGRLEDTLADLAKSFKELKAQFD
jgi:uncharacterized protein YceH (UPF0502 family)